MDQKGGWQQKYAAALCWFRGKRRMRKIMGSIRGQMVLICAGSMLFMQILLVSNYYQYRQMIMQDNSSRFQELLTQICVSVEENCTYLNNIVEQIAYSGEVQRFLETDDPEYRREHFEQVLSLLNSMAELKYGIKDIAVLDSQGNCLNLNGNIYQMRELALKIPEKQLYYYTGQNRLQMVPSARKIDCFTVGTQVYSTSDFTRKGKLGTVLVSVNNSCIFSFARYKGAEELPDMLIYDRDKKLAYSSVPKELDTSYDLYFDGQENGNQKKVVLGDEIYYMQTADLEMLGGKIVFLISHKELFSGAEKLQRRLSIFILLDAVVMAALFFLVLRRIINPVNQFMGYLSELKNGNFKLMKQPVVLSGAAEIEVMAEQFNDMMREINGLTHRLVDTTSRLYESKIEKQQAELEYMYSQINPHFLFNTLESIKGCAIEEDAGRTFGMVNALGRMFHYCVRSQSKVKLEEELRVVDSYMHLQQIRFEERLTFYNRVDAGLGKAIIPKMILQPLLENAVVHGMEQNKAVTVWLDAEVTDGILCLSVTDDGEILEEEKMETIQNGLNEKSRSSHIGMSNVHNRLKYIYGEEFGLFLDRERKRGFRVIIRMPFDEEGLEERAEEN